MLPIPAALAQATRLEAAGQIDAAEQLCVQILQADPEQAEAWHLLGSIARQRGRLDQSLQYLANALARSPGNAVYHASLAAVYNRQGRFEDAAASYRQALHFWPTFIEARNNLGAVYRRLGKLDDAVACCLEVLRQDPNFVVGLGNLGNALTEQGQLDEALVCYRRALEIRPRALAHSNVLMMMNYHPAFGPAELLAEHRRWDALYGQAETASAHANDRNPHRRLRIGYVSPDFRSHVVARFIEPIFQNHDPERVEWFGYSQVFSPDSKTARFKSLARGWRSICGLSAGQVADQVRQDRIDILVDLAGHTADNRLDLFTLTPAPIQVSYLGYPNTTGLHAMDYRLTDAVADPPGEPSCHAEELVRLPVGFCCYQPPQAGKAAKRWRLVKGEAQGTPEAAPIPEPNALPADRKGHITFGSFHQLAKLNAAVFDAWSAVLRALPSARLFLFRHTLTGSTQDHIRAQFKQRGIEEGRLELGCVYPSGKLHWHLYHEIDVLLDPFPWGGHATACESLWMGVPVLTLLGIRHAGRMVASVLNQMGLKEWIAATPEHYVAAGVKQVSDLRGLRSLRRGLRDQMRASSLCDGRGFTRRLEEVYRTLWQRWCEGPTANG